MTGDSSPPSPEYSSGPDSECSPPARVRLLRGDDRGLSTAVTHVLAIGITTILISGLLIAAAGLLTDQQNQSGRTDLQKIGDRIAEQVYRASTNVDEEGPGTGTQSATLRIDQPSRVAGYTYTANLSEGDACDGNGGINKPPNTEPDRCLVLKPAPGLGVDPVEIPVDVEGDPDDYDFDLRTVSSGEFVVTIEKD